MQDSFNLKPISSVNGTIYLPGSKSISNRVLLLASLAKGTTYLNNLLNSDDVKHMLQALKKIGIHYHLSDNKKECHIEGIGHAFQLSKPISLFLGNAGTAIRPLLSALSLNLNNDVILSGDDRMHERPIKDLVDALRQGGAIIEYEKNKGYPPIRTKGGFIGGSILLNGNISSQFLTSLLIAAPLASQNTTIFITGDLVSKPYIDITLNLIKSFSVNIQHDSYRVFYITGQQQYKTPGKFIVEGDASSASYFLAAAAIKGGLVKVVGIGKKSVQGDINFANVLEKMGAIIYWEDNSITCVRNKLQAIDLDMNHIPDAAMTIAIVALFAKGTTIIRNIYNWRVKETDRLSAMAIELKKIGAIVEEGKDFLSITPPISFKYCNINTYNDHRIAMCFSLIALSKVGVNILNPGCTAKTFPSYFKYFLSISQSD
ncbi:3-phosphoshikimate 1-carboxyvinyltransferase [Buchnera aphidicola]|uniref:3-phosphoshikimate 1-carboxyvinyltransferase n=1 Tax=Buchnera aphidicola str. USDA (Myzus persicae) TaxID=1009856 RepID=W0P4S7_BUCMP|nr:3-phosphoshikimate 1-carboxyvinyltransferase [Buchnera aphidicola]AHG60073.1 Aroa [Buchnera aphidicola str. USDA (Myzus persicae)]AHG60653.1 Aroa [Buchnera aphidicola str. W106 (Myzus persicae)]AHG61225.1 Aroa [Buchnera aphidicola str. G002 (Myzus persicae)]AHG61798.1 Aroa [Buchnera aphidicola str. F009 (Myzus persicae)]WAI03241.1 MAG: 3-phosphoshikimate 1-carboxyvinyltransferase [Buchnera aphidicola (Myzus persicae)]